MGGMQGCGEGRKEETGWRGRREERRGRDGWEGIQEKEGIDEEGISASLSQLPRSPHISSREEAIAGVQKTSRWPDSGSNEHYTPTLPWYAPCSHSNRHTKIGRASCRERG